MDQAIESRIPDLPVSGMRHGRHGHPRYHGAEEGSQEVRGPAWCQHNNIPWLVVGGCEAGRNPVGPVQQRRVAGQRFGAIMIERTQPAIRLCGVDQPVDRVPAAGRISRFQSWARQYRRPAAAFVLPTVVLAVCGVENRQGAYAPLTGRRQQVTNMAPRDLGLPSNRPDRQGPGRGQGVEHRRRGHRHERQTMAVRTAVDVPRNGC